jgi:hypothetical protein
MRKGEEVNFWEKSQVNLLKEEGHEATEEIKKADAIKLVEAAEMGVTSGPPTGGARQLYSPSEEGPHATSNTMACFARLHPELMVSTMSE